MRRKKKGTKGLLAVVLLFCMLTGCGGKENPGTESTKAKGTTEDCQENHGHYAIMETESGYYSNVRTSQKLVYYDKESGVSIPLCSKPECSHSGEETCAATFAGNKSINTLLYEGNIYILSVEKADRLVGFVLYKISLDASAIDKVATILEVENTDNAQVLLAEEGRQPEPFIIHRGCAYVPYYLRLGKASSGFKGGGLMKVDLQTGEKTVVYEMEYMTSAYPRQLAGCGDYVYFDVEKSFQDVYAGTVRYNLTTGEVANTPFAKEQKRKGQTFEYVTGDTLYDIFPELQIEEKGKRKIYHRIGYSFIKYDAESGEPIRDPESGEAVEEVIPMIKYEDFGGEEEEDLIRFYCWQDRYIVCTDRHILVYGKQDETLQCSIGYERQETEAYGDSGGFWGEKFTDFKICGDDLYRIENPAGVNSVKAQQINTVNPDLRHVYKMSLPDLISGGGEWIPVYTISRFLPQETKHDIYSLYDDYFHSYLTEYDW